MPIPNIWLILFGLFGAVAANRAGLASRGCIAQGQ